MSYLNTKPLLYGIEHSPVREKITLKTDYPAKIAQWLLQDEVDVGLVPVAVIPQLNPAFIISDYCIGCDGKVATVCLFSNVPIDEIRTVILDYQSQTSNELVKILLKNLWKVNPEFIFYDGEFRHLIKDNTAAVVIGDRAFEQKGQSKFEYDLGEAWKQLTGLPFVFAAWVSNKKLPASFIKAFNDANRRGVESINKVIEELQDYKGLDMKKYFTESIRYELDAEKKKALEKFLWISKSFKSHSLFEGV